MVKKVARKAAPKKVSVAKRTPAKKVAAKKAAPKRAAAKSTAKKTPVTESHPREFDEHGFVIGSDSSIIAEELMKGGTERTSVNDAIRERIEKESGLETRTGTQKNIPALVAGLLTRLKEKGYEVEATWRLVPPATPKRATSKAAPKKTAAKKAPAKKVAAKRPAKKVARKR